MWRFRLSDSLMLSCEGFFSLGPCRVLIQQAGLLEEDGESTKNHIQEAMQSSQLLIVQTQ
jgi:hypothetical protein